MMRSTSTGWPFIASMTSVALDAGVIHRDVTGTDAGPQAWRKADGAEIVAGEKRSWDKVCIPAVCFPILRLSRRTVPDEAERPVSSLRPDFCALNGRADA